MVSLEARIISLKKQSSPIVNENMAVMNVIKTKCGRFTLSSTPMNIAAIDIATHSRQR